MKYVAKGVNYYLLVDWESNTYSTIYNNGKLRSKRERLNGITHRWLIDIGNWIAVGFKEYSMNLRDEVSVVDYLTLKGFVFKRKGNKWFTNSPFVAGDKTPSFCVFPDGAYKDFSSGNSGNVITLARFFGDDLRKLGVVKKWVAPVAYVKPPWNGIPPRFVDLTANEKERVEVYAMRRGIISGYEKGCFFTKSDHGWDKHIAILFPHQNNGVITGAKFRALQPIEGQRFSSSGQLGFYILESKADSFEPTMGYLVEGEANANSLWEYFKLLKKPAIIASAGSVTSIPKTLPFNVPTKLLIDFDDSEEKYKDRVEKYKHLPIEPVKLILPKGEDLNSLWQTKRMSLLDCMI